MTKLKKKVISNVDNYWNNEAWIQSFDALTFGLPFFTTQITVLLHIIVKTQLVSLTLALWSITCVYLTDIKFKAKNDTLRAETKGTKS